MEGLGPRNGPRGAFITLEGGEGAGKSTQAAMLRDRLSALGRSVLSTREPGGSEGAEAIRRLLVEGDPERWDGVTEALLMIAARRDHVERTIRPALDAGTWVICDRFIDSTMAYQGLAEGIGADRVDRMHALALGDIRPDVTLVFDLDPKIGIARTKERSGAVAEDRFERKGAAFHERLRQAYRTIAAENPDRCRLVDASGSRESVENGIWDSLCSHPKLRSHLSPLETWP